MHAAAAFDDNISDWRLVGVGSEEIFSLAPIISNLSPMRQNDMNTDQSDILSVKAREILRLHAATAYGELVPSSASCTGGSEARELLASLAPDQLLNRFTANRDDGQAMLAGLWLWHDFLDESHKAAQQLETPNGCYWHAIMHRREGDFFNSKYWLARCANHPIYSTLAVRADDVIRPYPVDKSLFRLTSQGWNAGAYVDLVEQVHANPADPRHGLAVALQQLEWRLLFDHCTRGAAGD